MRRWIGGPDRRIEPAPANLAVHHHHRAYWHLAVCLGLARQFEGLPHEPLVFGVHDVGGTAAARTSSSTLSSTFSRKLLGFFMPHFT